MTNYTLSRAFAVISTIFLVTGASANAAELNGKVLSVSGQTLQVTLQGDSDPSKGDKAAIYFKVPGSDVDISVATAHVEKISGGAVELKVDKATGQVAKDHLVKITSENPQPRAASASTPQPTAVATASVTASPAATAAGATPAVTTSDGRDLSFACVDMNKLFKGYSKTRTDEAEINASKAEAKKEYDVKADAYKALLDEINKMNQKLDSMKTSSEVKTQLAAERDAKIADIKAMEKEINGWRQAKEAEMQRDALAKREKIIGEMMATTKSLASKTNLVLDPSGNSANGVPVAVFTPSEADGTATVAAALEAGNGGSTAIPAVRDVPIGIVDMNSIFKNYRKTKDAENKINTLRAQAGAELNRRTAEYRKLYDSWNGMRPGATKDKTATKLQTMNREIKEFQATKERQLQEQAVGMRTGIIKELTDAVAAGRGTPRSLILDKSGQTLIASPFVVASSGIPDFSDAIISALNSPGSAPNIPALPSSSGLRIACVDMDRLYHLSHESQSIDSEISRLGGTTPNATPSDPKNKEAFDVARSKRDGILAKISARVQQAAQTASYNLVLNSGGQTMNGTTFIAVTNDVPDLTDEILAGLKSSPP